MMQGGVDSIVKAVDELERGGTAGATRAAAEAAPANPGTIVGDELCAKQLRRMVHAAVRAAPQLGRASIVTAAIAAYARIDGIASERGFATNAPGSPFARSQASGAAAAAVDGVVSESSAPTDTFEARAADARAGAALATAGSSEPGSGSADRLPHTRDVSTNSRDGGVRSGEADVIVDHRRRGRRDIRFGRARFAAACAARYLRPGGHRAW